MELAHGFLHGIGEGITDVFGFTHLAGRNAVFVSVCLGVGFSKTIEVTAGEAGKAPLALFLHRKAHRLVALLVAADVDVKPLVLRQGGVTAFMPAGVVLANVSGGVAIFLHRLSNGDSRSRNILTLLWTFEFCLLLGNTGCLISV